MNKASLRKELMELTPAERIEIAQDLWDSVAPVDLPPLTDAELDEADRRLAEHRIDPSSALSWDEVRSWLWSRLR